MMKTGLLVAEKITALTPTLNGMGVYHNRAIASDRQVLYNYKYFFTNLGEGFSAEALDSFFNTLTMLRNKKFKTRADVINLGKLEQNIVLLKSEVNRASIHWMETNKLDSILNFYADETLNVYDESAELKADELFFRNYLQDEILDSEMFHFFGAEKAINIHQKVDLSDFDKELSIKFISTILFEIPCLDSFSYNQLRIIRNEFQEHLIPFHKALDEMKTKFETCIMTDENTDSLNKEFDEIIEPYVEFFKNLIGNNIYFQQIANSSTDHKRFQMNISFSTLETLLAVYKNAYVIDNMEYDILCEKIALAKDLISGIVFFEMAEIPAE